MSKEKDEIKRISQPGAKKPKRLPGNGRPGGREPGWRDNNNGRY